MIKNEKIKFLYDCWLKEFKDESIDFQNMLKQIDLNESFIKVFLINSKKTKNEKLNYNNYKKEGLNAITIGGYSLSRGFTIEGLTVSYFLRNSKMYDTLLQMGRWFGYRVGYEDLCRIYMREEAIDWYMHISEVINELKDDFKIMNDYNLTPRDYGLKVKNHDESLLIVTSRNKMFYSINATLSINYYIELIETRKISNDDKKIQHNLNNLKKFISNLPDLNRDKNETKNFLWRDISISIILEFIKRYKNHPLNIKTDTDTIEKYLIAQNINNFDVAIISNRKKDSGSVKLLDNIEIYKEMRSSFIDKNTLQISGDKSRVGSINDEKIGLNLDDIDILKKKSLDKKTLSGVDYRQIRKKPLLIIHILKIQKKGDKVTPII